MQHLLTVIFFITALVLFVYRIQAKTADEIIEKHIAAIGGESLISEIKNICMIGTREMMGHDVPVRVVKIQGKLFRTDFIMLQKGGYILINEFGGWQYIPMLSENVKQISPESFSLMKDELDIPGTFIDYISKGNKVKLLGKEEVNGIDTYKIQMTTLSGRTIIYLIDRQTYVVIQTREMRKDSSENGANKFVEVVTDFSNYKRVEGILFAHKITNPGYGPLNGSVMYNNIIVNQKLPDNIYLPQPLQQIN